MGCSHRRSEPSRSSFPETEGKTKGSAKIDATHVGNLLTEIHIVLDSSYLESWRTAAPVDLHQVAVADAMVLARTRQTRVTLGQHCRVHIT